MFPYAHHSKTTRTKRRTGTTLDDAIRTDLQQVLLPLYMQRLQRYEQQENGVIHGMGTNTANASASAYTTVFLPLFIETKMGLLLRRQSIVSRTTSKNITNDDSNDNNNENATAAVVDVSTSPGHNGHQQRKRGGGRINNSSSTKSPRRRSTTTTRTKYYGFVPSQRCDLHSYIQFVFSVVQDEIQKCLFRQRRLSFSLETDTGDTTGNCVYTISFYIFTFFTLIQSLHPPPPPSSSESSAKYATLASTGGDWDKSSNGDSVLSHLSMGVQSYDNPKVLYRRMHHQYTRIRMTIQFYHLIVQLLMTTQQQLSNSSCRDHATNARLSVIYTVRTDIKLILLRLIDNTAQYFDLASYHGPCNLEGYTWQRDHAPVVPNDATKCHNVIVPVNEEAAMMENAAMDESICPHDENNGATGTSSTIHRAIKAYLQSTSTFDRMSDGSGDSNPLQHLLRKYYSEDSIAISSKNPDQDNSNNSIDSDMVNIPAMSTTNRNYGTTTLNTKTAINHTHIYDPLDGDGGGGGVSPLVCEQAERLVGNDSDDDDDDDDAENVNGVVSKSFTSRATEASNGDDYDSIISTTSPSNNGNNIGQMALSKLLQHVTHQTPSPQPRRQSKFTYGDFFLLQEQPDLDDNDGDVAATIVSTQKQKKHGTKQVRKGSKAEQNKTTKVAKKHKPKKMLPLPSMVPVGDDSMFPYQSSIGDDKINEDDSTHVELDDNDNDDSLADEFAIATTGHDALSKLLLLARPK